MRLGQWMAALLLAVMLLAAPAGAQTEPAAIDYDAWGAVAQRAEAAVESRKASVDAFESLRTEIVTWRDQFLAAQSTNAARIKTLKSQIEALGPAPAEGETEAEDVAARRAELKDQLAQAEAPVKRAVEAYSRADGIAREIDGIIRAQQTDALLTLAPTPLNPAIWPDAVASVATTARAMKSEVAASWGSDAKQQELRQNLPRTVFYVLVAVILLLRGRAVMERVTGAVFDRFKGHGHGVFGFVASLGQILVPVVGIMILVEALQSTGLLGLRGLLLTDMLPLFGLYVFGARWLGLRLFPKRSDVPSTLQSTPEQAASMRRVSTLLGFLVGLRMVVEALARYDQYSDATLGVLLFPAKLLIGLALLQVARRLIAFARQRQRQADDSQTQSGGSGAVLLIGRLTGLLALTGMIMASIGYFSVGVFLLVPTVFSLALIGLLVLLNQFTRDIYSLTVGCAPEDARAALTPTLISFVLGLASLPVFALIWGARVADLTELWARFQEGFTFGDTRISPQNFLTFAIVFVALYLATRLFQGALRNSVLPKTRIDTGGQNAIISGVGYLGIVLAAMLAITSAGIDLSSLAFVAGALSIGVGFGLQNIVQNFVSGIILLIERPVAEGDWIEVGGHTGIVRKISVRSTLIETFDRTDVVVPNGDFIASAVTNWTRSNTIGRIKVQVGVAYGTDTRRVSDILMEIAQEHPLVTVDPAPGVDFLGFGADSLDFQIRAVLRDVNFSLSVKTEMHHRIAERFAEEGIEIPFAQRDIWLRNPEALRQVRPEVKSLPSSARDLKLGEDDMELEPGQIGDAEGDAE